MRFLFWLSVIISGLVAITGFTLTNIFTVDLHPTANNDTGGNGNAGLMFVLFPMLIILYFFFTMIFVFEKIHERLKANKKRFLIGYISLLAVIISYSVFKIITFHHEIRPYFEHEIGYLNPFSNHLYFNAWTFIACLCCSAICSFFSRATKTS